MKKRRKRQNLAFLPVLGASSDENRFATPCWRFAMASGSAIQSHLLANGLKGAL